MSTEETKKSIKSENRDSGYYVPLSHNSNLGLDDPRVRLLSKCIEDEDIKNIAIVGPYGSGKTSIVKSFFKCQPQKRKVIYFSYDTFKEYKDENKPNNGSFDIKEAVYKELLKRDTSSIVLNKFLKHLFYFKREIVVFILFILMAFSACVTGGWFLFNKLSYLVIPLFISIFLLSLLMYVSFTINRISFGAKGKGSIEAQLDIEQKYNLSNDIEKNPYLVENAIIKKLKNDNVGFFVIEDLDRIEGTNCFEMVKSLKVMNDLLNHSKEFEKPSNRMVFIFCIKDDVFVNSEKRTKYFDFIIPVVPYASYSNAPDSVLTNDYISNNVDKSVIVDLSTYLIDQRQVNALIVEFNVNRQKTYSHDLLTELYALTVFNVRFPILYAKLYEKNNFLKSLIDAYQSNQNILDSLNQASINNTREAAFEPLKNVLNSNNIDEVDKKDFFLFIKTCLKQKYITSNFESLLCSNIENELFASDIEFLHSFQAGEYKNYYRVINPLSLLQHKSDSSYLFTNKRGLNASLIIYLESTKDTIAKVEQYRSVVSSTIKELTNEEIVGYISGADDDIKEQLCRSIHSLSKDYVGIYVAASKIENQEIREKVCFEFFNSLSFQLTDTNKKSLNEFGKCTSSESFLSKYGDKLSTNNIVLLNKSNLFRPVFLEYLPKDESLHKELAAIGNYDISFENLCALFDHFSESPIHYLLSDAYIFQNIKNNIELFINILNKSGLKNTLDTGDEVKHFIGLMYKNGTDLLLNSNYFEQWKHKLKLNFEASSLYFSFFEKGFIDYSNTINDLENVRQYMPELLTRVLEEQSDYYNTFSFDEKISWHLAFNMNVESLEKYKQSLKLTNAIQRLNSIDFNRFITIFSFLSEKEKQSVAEYLMQNSPSSLVKLYQTNKELLSLLRHSKINAKFLDAVMNSDDKQLLNLCVLPQNCDTAKEYMKANKNLDYNRMFIGVDNEILQCDNLGLILEYCIQEKRDFKFVRELVTSLNENMTKSFEDWVPFFDSFMQDKKSNYYYFENNENNLILCQFFLSRNVFKRLIETNSNSIRCLY